MKLTTKIFLLLAICSTGWQTIFATNLKKIASKDTHQNKATSNKSTKDSTASIKKKYTIVGLIAAQDTSNSVAVLRDNRLNQTKTIKVGSKLDSKTTVKSIQSSKVELIQNGKTFDLKFQKNKSYASNNKKSSYKEELVPFEVFGSDQDYDDPPPEVIESAKIIKEYYDQQVEKQIQRITRIDPIEIEQYDEEQFFRLEDTIEPVDIETIEIDEIILPPIQQTVSSYP